MKSFSDTIKNPIWMKHLWRALRVTLGGVFVYASIEKIIDPEQFAFAISNYKLFPKELLNIFALLLPWVEATIGIFLMFGLFEWVSLSLYNILMSIFMVLIAISLARGLDITCGCFTSDPNAENMTWLTFFRDSLLLGLGIGAYPLLFRLSPPPFLKSK